MKRRQIGCALALLTMVFAAACGSKEAPKEEGPKKPSEDVIAFKYGIRYADACIWATLGEPAKQAEDFEKAKILAEALGMPMPTAPSKDNGIQLMDGEVIANELKAKKGDKMAALFSLGTHIKVGLFGSILGSDTSGVIGKIETYAKASGIPESVWKADIEALKTSPKGNFDKLTQDLSSFLEK